MLQFNKLLLQPSANAKVLFQPVSLVINGNKYLESLSKNIDNNIAKEKLENMKIIVKNQNKSSILNARDWVHELYLNGNGYMTLSKKENSNKNNNYLNRQTDTNNRNNKNLELMLITSNNNDKHQSFIFETKSTTITTAADNTYPTILENNSSFSNDNSAESMMRWRRIALGDIKERIREAVESMRDFAILNIDKINLPESDKSTYLNALSTAEKFIQMDVMIQTKKDKERLFDYLQLPSEYTSSAQARVALQILNAAMSAWIFDYPTTLPISEQNQKINEEFLRLSKDLYESILDSVICSTNYIE